MSKYEIPAGFAKGRFVPDVTIELEEENADNGVWHQKFTLRRSAFEQKTIDWVGAKIDLSDADALAYFWWKEREADSYE
jgi:hypothetical protein